MNDILTWVGEHQEILSLGVSALSFLTAAAAIVVSVQIERRSRKFNQNSVKPLLSFELVDLPHRVAVKIRNDGVGVGIITDVRIFPAGIGGGSWNVLLNAIEAMDEEKQLSNRGIWKRYQQPIKGIAIAPGAERFLIELENKPTEQTAALRQILGKLEMEIIYTDIYDKPQKHLKSDFQYFDRADRYMI